MLGSSPVILRQLWVAPWRLAACGSEVRKMVVPMAARWVFLDWFLDGPGGMFRCSGKRADFFLLCDSLVWFHSEKLWTMEYQILAGWSSKLWWCFVMLEIKIPCTNLFLQGDLKIPRHQSPNHHSSLLDPTSWANYLMMSDGSFSISWQFCESAILRCRRSRISSRYLQKLLERWLQPWLFRRWKAIARISFNQPVWWNVTYEFWTPLSWNHFNEFMIWSCLDL